MASPASLRFRSLLGAYGARGIAGSDFGHVR
jgi:hypothetical protein